MRTRLTMLSCCAGLLAGCASEPGPDERAQLLNPVVLALSSEPAMLRQAAEAGDAEAQLSYSIVLKAGLNGATPDLLSSIEYAKRASAPRGVRTNAIYIPGFRGHAGSVSLINSPVYAVSHRQLEVVNACVAWLEGRIGSADACGSTQTAHDLAGAWRKARRH